LPIAAVIAVGLLALIGLSGIAAGLELLANLGAAAGGTPWTGIAIGVGIAGYGAIAALAAVGIWRGSRRAWWAAVGTIVAGIVVLAAASRLVGAIDEVFAGGVLLWSTVLVALLAPGTRARLRR
jgi:hypothetical protein